MSEPMAFHHFKSCKKEDSESLGAAYVLILVLHARRLRRQIRAVFDVGANGSSSFQSRRKEDSESLGAAYVLILVLQTSSNFKNDGFAGCNFRVVQALWLTVFQFPLVLVVPVLCFPCSIA